MRINDNVVTAITHFLLTRLIYTSKSSIFNLVISSVQALWVIYTLNHASIMIMLSCNDDAEISLHTSILLQFENFSSQCLFPHKVKTNDSTGKECSKIILNFFYIRYLVNCSKLVNSQCKSISRKPIT